MMPPRKMMPFLLPRWKGTKRQLVLVRVTLAAKPFVMSLVLIEKLIGSRMMRAMQEDAALSKDRLKQECSAAVAYFEAQRTARTPRMPRTPREHSTGSSHLISITQSLGGARADDTPTDGRDKTAELAEIPPRPPRTPRHHRPSWNASCTAPREGDSELYKSWADLKGRLQPLNSWVDAISQEPGNSA